jgi:flagellar hook assembly protein FlgD
LAVYDVQGRVVAQLMDGVQRAGRHSHRWDGRDHQGRLLPAGTYFLRLEFAGRVETQKLSLVR